MKRPIVVEFTGLPNSGKTTLLRSLKEHFDCKGVNAIIMQEQAELLPKTIPKGSIEQNLWITLEALQNSLEVGSMSDADYILQDRGFYNQYFWVKSYSERDESYSKFMLGVMDEFARRYPVKPDYMYIIDVDVDVSLKRRLVSGEPVTFSKREFLEKYKKDFGVFARGLEKVLYLDTTYLSKEQVADVVFKKLINL